MNTREPTQGIRLAVLAVVAAALPASLLLSQPGLNPDDEAIRGVIMSAYIDGMHMNSSRAAVREGFHPAFYMFVRTEGDSVRHVTIDEWVERLPPEGTAPRHEVTAEVDVLSREGGAAAASASVFFDGKQVFTDYFLLYRLDGQWRIMGKVFEGHR